MKPTWIAVASAEQLSEDGAIEVVVDQQIVAIFRCGEDLYALDGMCAHQGGPLAEGDVQNGCVTCPWHGWQYELASGIQTVNRKPLQKTYDVRQQNGQIEIKV